MPRTARTKKPQPTLTDKNPQPAADEQPKNKKGAPGRQANGQFARGNPGGPGNPHARFSAQLLTIARQTMTAEKMVNVFEAIYVRALTGDINAAKLLLHYTIGKPGNAPHPDHIERDEWDLYQKNAMTLEEMKQALGSLPCSLGNEIVGAALPAMTAARANELAEQLRGEGIGPTDERKDEGKGMKDEPKGRRRPPKSKCTQNQAAASVNPSDVDIAPPLTNRDSNGEERGDSHRRSAKNQSSSTSASTHDSPTTSHQPPATNSEPLTNRISNGSSKANKRRKLVGKQWLQPLARKLTGRKQKRKKRQVA